MKKFLISLSLLLVLASCTSTPTDNKQTINIPTKSSSVNTTTYTQDIESTSSKIRDTSEFQGCMKQQATMCIQTTGMQIAQKTKDATFCKELSNVDQRSSCEFAITMINAQEKNDIKLCESLTNSTYMKQCKSQIYRQEAVAKHDITLCNKLDTLEETTQTGANTPMNRNSAMQKDQCITQVIMNSPEKKEEDCNTITDTGSVNMCKMMLKNKPPVPPIGLPTRQNPPSVQK